MPVMFLCALALAGCQSGAPNPRPTPAAATSTAPVAQRTTNAPGLFFDGFDMLDVESGWAWKGISQLYRTDDAGATWHEIHLQGRMEVTGASFLSSQEAWLPGVPDADLNRSVYHTTDGGRSWTKLGDVRGPNLELRFHDEKTGWALNGEGAAGNVFYEVYRTTDGGESWAPLEAAGPAGANPGPMTASIHTMTGDALAFMPPNTIWLASGYGLSTPFAGLKVSRDGGSTWQDLDLALPPEYVKDKPPVVAGAPQFVTGQDAFLPVTAGNRLIVFASRDGGQTWRLLPAVMPSAQMTPRVQFVNTRDGFAVCASGLCATQDGGQTWQQIATPFPFGSSAGGPFVSQFDFVDALAGWAILIDPQAGSDLIKTTDGGRTWTRLMPRLGF